MYDICLELKEHCENLALIGDTLGAGGVNIHGLSLAKYKGRDLIHLAVDDAGRATQLLGDSGIGNSGVSEVYVLDKDRKKITGKPGNFGGICRALADHGIMVSFGYPIENNRFVFGVDDLEAAREVLE